MSNTPMPAARTVSDEAILDQFRAADDPFLTAGEVADGISLSRDAVNYRLKQLLTEDRVGRKKVGARAVGWWLRD